MAEAPKKEKPMKAVIFAGGVGTRMWPLSRKCSPKQFEPIIEGKSTLQLAVERIRPEFAWEDVYISTGEVYREIITKQLPQIPDQNIIGEPEMRDVAPAVGYLMSIIAKTDPDSPVAVLWSDHLVQNVNSFKEALLAGGDFVRKNPDKFVFIGQKPRFANQNLGWIEFGDSLEPINGFQPKRFVSWHYRPDLATAQKYFKGSQYVWNPGYMVVAPKTVLNQYKKHAPEMHNQLLLLQESFGTPHHQEVLKGVYPKMEKVHFDNAIAEKITADEAVVLPVDLGWSDIGTWEALKEALQAQPSDNLTLGKVETLNTVNSLVYSYTDQMVAVVDMDNMVVVVTQDAILVTKQSSIPQIKDLLKRFEGTKKEKYT